MPATLVPAPILLMLVAVYALAIMWRGRTFRIWVPPPGKRTRARRMLAWALGLGTSFGIPAVVGMALIGQDPLAAMQPEAITIVPGDWPLLPTTPLLLGMALGTIANAAITHWRWRRWRRALQIGTFPDVLPRTRTELLPAVVLAISAGVSEELFFRLFVPLLVASVFGSAMAGTVVATVMFGVMHRYQGWRGALATTLGGLGLALVYGLIGVLWIAIVLHAVIDLNALVVRPMARGAWRRSCSERRD